MTCLAVNPASLPIGYGHSYHFTVNSFRLSDIPWKWITMLQIRIDKFLRDIFGNLDGFGNGCGVGE